MQNHIVVFGHDYYILQLVDIFHPSVSLEWEECKKLPVGVQDPQCVLLNDKLYVGGASDMLSMPEDMYVLYVSNTDLRSWSTLTTPIGYYGLSTFKSQLVLVGGRDEKLWITDRLWLSCDGTNWNDELAPMPLKCFSPTVVKTSCGPLERLIVAGGVGEEFAKISTVRVFSEEQWWTVELRPVLTWCLRAIEHDGYLIAMGEGEEFTTSLMAYCKMDSFLEAAMHPGTDADPSRLVDLWKCLDGPLESPNAVSLGRDLLAVGAYTFTSKIFGYSFTSHSWVHIGDMPQELLNSGIHVLPSGDMLVLGGAQSGRIRDFTSKVYRACFKGDYTKW